MSLVLLTLTGRNDEMTGMEPAVSGLRVSASAAGAPFFSGEDVSVGGFEFLKRVVRQE